jgi:hypothetical protein
MQGAFTGRYLRVNLTQGSTTIEQFPDLHYRMYMGGAAMAAAILLRELPAGVDPLGPDNILVMGDPLGPDNILVMGDVAKYDKLALPRLLRDKLAILGYVPPLPWARPCS